MLEHRKRTRREGVETVVVVGATVAILAGFMAALLAWRAEKWPFATAWFLVLAIFVVLAGAYAVLNIAANGEFVCRLDDKTLECVSPVRGYGESFKLPIADIVRIERRPGTTVIAGISGTRPGSVTGSRATTIIPLRRF